MPQLTEPARSPNVYAPNWVEPQDVLDALTDLHGTKITIIVELKIEAVGGATPAASLYAGVITQVFGVPLGITAVRYIAGTSTWSQHAYGNAVDAMATGSLLHRIASFANANRSTFSIAHLLADPWFPSPRGDHFNHCHADFEPSYGGTPPGHPI
jgi:hypothetical protein